MRRAARLIVAMALSITGIAFTYGARPGVTAGRPTAARLTARVSRAGAAAGPGMKVVRYAGYAIDVPAGWPVYRLDRDPSRCVRYDRHAVYLGRPGSDQRCPAHLVGRVSTVSLQASTAAGGTSAAPVWGRPAPSTGLARGLGQPGGVVTQDSAGRELRVVLRDPALTVTATYGTSPALVAKLIRSVRRDPGAGAARSAAATGAPAAHAPAGGSLAAAGPAPARTAGAAALMRAVRRPKVPLRLAGFDTCAAPPLPVMARWRTAYSTVAIYIGGPNAACGWGNLSRVWVREAIRMGWSLVPTYVGPQAPCTRFPNRIRVGHARVEGQVAAEDAIRLASALGLRRGAPIYDDMEWFNPANGTCRRQVLSFLNGWTRQLHARGYLSGVYSSASAAVSDLGQASMIYGQRLVKPDAVWFALWNGQANLQGEPYLAASWWPGHRRIKQYQGSHRQTVGGATLDIDSDLVYGPVYR